MRIKEGYILRKFLDKWVAVYTGEPSGAPGMITMNKTGAFLWEQLLQPISREELLRAMLERYDVDEATAGKELDSFLRMLRQKGILEETK